jgi:hypothetical protein
MKKILITTVVFLAFSILASAQVENTAKEILKAYKNRDLELLKKNASGILKMAIKDGYFESNDLQDAIKVVDNWDGKIREIRYTEEKVMGKTAHIAAAYFADHPDNKDEIYWVALSRMGGSDWVMFAKGLMSDKKSEFEKMNPSLTGAQKDRKDREAREKFSVEMANGDTFDKVSTKKIEKLINKLNGDNFFIILNKGDKDFLQAAYSENGYSVQYKENNKQYEAKEILDKAKTVELFKSYFDCDKDWKKDIKWQSY